MTFSMGRSLRLLGTMPLCSCLARVGTNFRIRSIYPLFSCLFAQPLNTRPPYNPSNELTPSRSPQIPANPPDHPPPTAPWPPTFPELEPLRKPSRNRPQSSESIPSRLCFNLCTKPWMLSPTTDRFLPPAERTSYCEYHSLFCFISLYSGRELLF